MALFEERNLKLNFKGSRKCYKGSISWQGESSQENAENSYADIFGEGGVCLYVYIGV